MNKLIFSLSVLGIGFLLSCKDHVLIPSIKNGKSLLWEISGNGLNKPSYFLGTMHLMCAEDAVLSDKVKSLIKETEQVYLEVDMDNASELFSGMMDMLPKNNGKSLDQVLTHEEYNRVQGFFCEISARYSVFYFGKATPAFIIVKYV